MSLGDRLSDAGAVFAGRPLAQGGLLAISIGWIAAGRPVDMLTLALSILAITLSQMVLNRQCRREADDRGRDEAMHAKLDELLHGVPEASDALAGIEQEGDRSNGEPKQGGSWNDAPDQPTEHT